MKRYLLCIPIVFVLVALAPAGECHAPVVVQKVIPHVDKVVEAVPVITPVVPQAVFQYVPVLQIPPALGYVGTAAYPGTQAALPAFAPPGRAACPTAADIERIVSEKVAAALRTRPLDGPPAIPGARQPEALPQPQAQAGQQGRGDDAWVQAMGRNCYSCHNAQERKGGVSLFTLQGQEANYAPSVGEDRIDDAIRSGRMPKDSQMSEADRNLILSRNVRR
jgi:hypothetical protein